MVPTAPITNMKTLMLYILHTRFADNAHCVESAHRTRAGADKAGNAYVEANPQTTFIVTIHTLKP